MDDENPTRLDETASKPYNNENLLKIVTGKFHDMWIGFGILALIIFCVSALMGVFTKAFAYYLIPAALSISFYWCWKLLKNRKGLVLYVYLGLAILVYILVVMFIYNISRGLSAPFSPDWVSYLIPGIALTIPAFFLFRLKRNRILQ